MEVSLKSNNSSSNLNSPLVLLHEAATRNQLSELMRLLDQGAVEVNQVDPNYKWTALHLASRNGHVKLCLELIRRGAKIDACDAMGQTPLHRAAYWDHFQVVEALIQNGADFTVMDNMGQTPIELAIQGNSSKSVSLIRNCYVALELQPQLLRQYSQDRVIHMKRSIEEKQRVEKELSMAKKREIKVAKEKKKFYKKEMELMEERQRIQQKMELAKKELSSLGSTLSSSISSSSSSSTSLDKTKKDLLKKEKKLQEKLQKYQEEIDKKEIKIAYNRRSSLETNDVNKRAEVWLDFINSY